jgi:hypothetical protein
VLPLPVDSLNAAQVLKSLHVSPGMIHLDSGHDYESVRADLRVWWQVLAPGAILIGDDYYTDGTWASVHNSFDDFFGALNLTPIENVGGQCRVQEMLATLTTGAWAASPVLDSGALLRKGDGSGGLGARSCWSGSPRRRPKGNSFLASAT